MGTTTTNPGATGGDPTGQASLSESTAGQAPGCRSGPGLSFALENPKGLPSIYLTSDPTLNILTLTVTNQTGQPLALNGGTPVAEDQVTSNGPTSLYLTLDNLLDPAQLPTLQVSATGWQAQFFSGDLLTNWALTPLADLVLPDQGSIVVTLTHLIVAGEARPARLTVDYKNVPGVDDDSVQVLLSIQNAPTEPRDLHLQAGFAGSNVVYVTRDAAPQISNALVFYVANPTPATPLVPNDVPWGPSAPVFFLSFATRERPGYGALTTADRAKTIQVQQSQPTSGVWNVGLDGQQDAPSWRLMPQHHEVLGLEDASRVGFTISNIITYLEPETLPTPLYLQWSNIPGYNDGALSLPIVKALPTPGILWFRALTPETVHAGDPIELTWNSFAVARLVLSFGAGQQIVELDSATGQIGLNAERFPLTSVPLTSTVFNLDAYDDRGAKVDSASIPITVIEPPITIASFTASPHATNFATGPVDVTLSWSATPSHLVKSLEVEGWGDVTGRTSYVAHGVSHAGPFTLRAVNLSGNETVASAGASELKEHLVARTYSVRNVGHLAGHVDQVWSTDTLEFFNPVEGRYTAWRGTIRASDNQRSIDPSYPREYLGKWSLAGNVIQLATSLGVLRFLYLENRYGEEMLDFQTPTFTNEIPRSSLLMKPGLP